MNMGLDDETPAGLCAEHTDNNPARKETPHGMGLRSGDK